MLDVYAIIASLSFSLFIVRAVDRFTYVFVDRRLFIADCLSLAIFAVAGFDVPEFLHSKQMANVRKGMFAIAMTNAIVGQKYVPAFLKSSDFLLCFKFDYSVICFQNLMRAFLTRFN